MSQRDGFAGGFFLGALVGGAVGGVLGAVVATRSRQINEGDEENRSLLSSGRGGKIDTEEGMEKARRRLEDKIAQLNNAIDDVRQQLGPTNGSTSEQEMH